MCYWDDGDYFEPSEFDEKIEELKNELRESVKKEINDEIEKLRKENKELQGIKRNFESVKKDFERKKDECDRAIRNAESKAKQARLKELMEHFKVTLWAVSWDYRYKKKCDKCDKNRRIQVALPSGKTVDDECSCRVSKKVYYPKENVLYELSERNREFMAWYMAKGDRGEEYFVGGPRAEYAKVVVDHNKDFKEIETEELRKVFFTTKEECQVFCNYINGTEVLGYDYNVEGQPVVQREETEQMNKVILMGRLTRDPEVRYSQGEQATAVARYTLAVDRRGRNQENSADFIQCVAFGKAAEFAERYLHKGTKIVLTGRIQTGSYTNKDGQRVYTTDIVVEDQEFAESKTQKAATQEVITHSLHRHHSRGMMDLCLQETTASYRLYRRAKDETVHIEQKNIQGR